MLVCMCSYACMYVYNFRSNLVCVFGNSLAQVTDPTRAVDPAALLLIIPSSDSRLLWTRIKAVRVKTSLYMTTNEYTITICVDTQTQMCVFFGSIRRNPVGMWAVSQYAVNSKERLTLYL